MSLKHGLLGLIGSDGSMTGYELDKLFKNSLAYFWQAKTSQIYRELSAMEDAGWLSSERVVQEDKPNKRVYSITGQGREELINWITSPHELSHGTIRSTFLMRIFFAGEAEELGKEQTLKMLKEYRERCNIYGDSLLEAERAIEEEEKSGLYAKHIKYWKLTLMHGLMSIKMSQEWAEKAIALLED